MRNPSKTRSWKKKGQNYDFWEHALGLDDILGDFRVKHWLSPNLGALRPTLSGTKGGVHVQKSHKYDFLRNASSKRGIKC